MAGNNSKIGGGGFHHVAIKARDFDATLRFYKEALGFTEWIRWGQGEGRAVMLDAGDGNYLEVFAGGTPATQSEGAILHFALRTDNCDTAIERARAGGAVVTKEPFDVLIPSTPGPTPVRLAFCKGLDGEIIEFFQHRKA
jgi:glyoxylase I family protein